MSWDDGKHAKVKKVQLTFDDVIRSIQVEYDGTTLQSQPRGPAGNKSDGFTLSSDEYITELTGYYRTIFSGDVITALTFKTNKKTYGPYGNKTNQYFSATAPKDQQIAGFHGTSGNALNSIDVHFAPITLSGSTGTYPSGNTGGTGTNPSGSTGTNPSGSTGTNPSGSTGGTGTNPSGNTGGSTGTNPSGNTGGSTGTNPSGNTGGSTGTNPSGNTGGTGTNPSGNTGGSTGTNPSGNTGGSTGNNPSGNTGGTGTNPSGNTGGSTGTNPSGNTGGSTGTNPSGNTGGSTGTNPSGNTGGSTGTNPSGNTGGAGTNPSGSTGDTGNNPSGNNGANTGSSPQKVEAQGGKGGNQWDDGANYDGVTKIDIAVGGEGIAQIRFDYLKNGQATAGPAHGVKGRNFISTIKINHPDEYLVSVKGWSDSNNIIQGIQFITNTKTSDFFGYEFYGDGTQFSLEVKDKKIVGFHGFADSSLNSIGAYFVPVATLTPLKPAKKLNAIGGDEGALWDDGAFDGVKKVHVGQGNDGVAFVTFEYDKGSQTVISDGHGKKTILGVETFELDYPSEYITAVGVFYDKVLIEKNGMTLLTSLIFKTNKRTSQPFGMTGGEYFEIKEEGHKIVGFHGKASDYINQIGVYVVSVTN